MKYVISSSVFASKKKALDQIREWDADGTLDNNARVYEVKKSYRPAIPVEWGLYEETRKKGLGLGQSKSKVKKGV